MLEQIKSADDVKRLVTIHLNQWADGVETNLEFVTNVAAILTRFDIESNAG